MCACNALCPKRSALGEWSCHSPHSLCSGSHRGALRSAQAGFLSKPKDVLRSQTSATLAARGYSDRNHFVQSSGEHEWAAQQPGKFHTQKGPTSCRGRCLELEQSKSPLKCVQGGCQVCSIKGFALQTCSYLSTAFAHEFAQNTSSDATSTPSWEMPTPSLSPAFPCLGN